MPPGSKSDTAFSLTRTERAGLRPDIDLDAFERLLAVLPPPARPLFLRLAAREPDLLAIWEAAPALRLEERGPMEPDPHYHGPKLQVYVVPRLEDVTLSDPVLQKMLSTVFRKR
jgi:hypothetical protein